MLDSEVGLGSEDGGKDVAVVTAIGKAGDAAGRLADGDVGSEANGDADGEGRLDEDVPLDIDGKVAGAGANTEPSELGSALEPLVDVDVRLGDFIRSEPEAVGKAAVLGI